MSRVTYDTNIFIKRKPQPISTGFYMSIIVLQELVAGASDASAVKELKRSFLEWKKTDRLLVPDMEDWWQVGNVINALQRGRRSNKTGLIPKMSLNERHRITNDVLIARTAKRAGVTVVTDNVSDFQKIKNFCNVRVISGRDFFGKHD
jgi:predicted nucleic acid-binding protein